MADQNESDLDKLLAEAQSLKKRADEVPDSQALQSSPSPVQRLATNIEFFRKLVESIIKGYSGFHERFVAPVWRLVGPLFRWIFRFYGTVWNKCAYRTCADGSRHICRKRAGLCVAFSLVVVLAFTPTHLGSAIRFVTVEPLSDGLLMLTSLKEETFYLNHSEEIDPLGNEHSVRGCKHAGQCTELDAAYFRVKPRLSHDIWKLFTQGNPIYVPDHVVAPIAPGVNRCSVTYYGYRMTSSWISRLIRSLEIYPVMLDARCEYLGSQVSSAEKP